MSNTVFESGGKCPPLLIIGGGGQMSSYIIFHRGQMSEGGKCPTLGADMYKAFSIMKV